MNPYRSYPPGETDPKRALKKLKAARDQLSMFGAVINDPEHSVVPRIMAHRLLSLINQRRCFLTTKIIDLDPEFSRLYDQEKLEIARQELGMEDTEENRRKIFNWLRSDFEHIYGIKTDNNQNNVQKQLQN